MGAEDTFIAENKADLRLELNFIMQNSSTGSIWEDPREYIVPHGMKELIGGCKKRRRHRDGCEALGGSTAGARC